MRRDSSPKAGSLDMLLDTMCNTFGGVCFIALMVAIISASLPSKQDAEETADEVTEQMVVDKEMARLKRERDELKSAIEIQKLFVATNSTKEARAFSAAQLAMHIASNTLALAKLKSEKLELEDKLAKTTTDSEYSRREALRLERLLKEMEERLGQPANMKNRAVRTPVERELGGYKSLDVWIRNGRMYCLHNESHVDCKTSEGLKGKQWEYRILPGRGYLLNEEFFHSSEYRGLVEMISGKVYMRIYVDAASFSQLCELRDDLIRRRKMYNWHATEDQTLYFVEGYDGRVQ